MAQRPAWVVTYTPEAAFEPYTAAATRPDGLSPEEVEFARSRRAMGAGWDAIGAMLGRRGADVRLIAEPPPEAPQPAPAELVAKICAELAQARPPVVRRPPPPKQATRPGSVEAQVLAILGGREAMTMAGVAKVVGRTSAWAGVVLQRLVSKGLAQRAGFEPIEFSISPAGQGELNRHQAAAGAPNKEKER